MQEAPVKVLLVGVDIGEEADFDILWKNWQVWQKPRRRKLWARSYNGWIM